MTTTVGSGTDRITLGVLTTTGFVAGAGLGGGSLQWVVGRYGIGVPMERIGAVGVFCLGVGTLTIAGCGAGLGAGLASELGDTSPNFNAGAGIGATGVALLGIPSAYHGIRERCFQVDTAERVSESMRSRSTARLMLAGGALIAIGGVTCLAGSLLD